MAKKVQIIPGLMHLHQIGSEIGSESHHSLEEDFKDFKGVFQRVCGICNKIIRRHEWCVNGQSASFHPDCVIKKMKGIEELLRKAKKQAVAKSL